MARLHLIYFSCLKYRRDNLDLLHKYFEVLELPNPSALDATHLANCHAVIFPLGWRFGVREMEQAPLLKVIASNTTGHPHIDVEAARRRGVEVVTLKIEKEFLDGITPTAELAWALVMLCVRPILPAMDAVLSGEWDRRPFAGNRMLSRMTLGVIGLGRLGSKVAAYGLAAGMKVSFYDTSPSVGMPGAIRVESLEKLVAASDIVTLHVPHEIPNEGMISRELFEHFREGSCFINTARGELVDHDALIGALESGRLSAAALDVVEGEFDPDFAQKWPLHRVLQYAREHRNLMLTPHIGGSTEDAWTLTEHQTIRRMLEVLGLEGRTA